MIMKITWYCRGLCLIVTFVTCTTKWMKYSHMNSVTNNIILLISHLQIDWVDLLWYQDENFETQEHGISYFRNMCSLIFMDRCFMYRNCTVFWCRDKSCYKCWQNTKCWFIRWGTESGNVNSVLLPLTFSHLKVQLPQQTFATAKISRQSQDS